MSRPDGAAPHLFRDPTTPAKDASARLVTLEALVTMSDMRDFVHGAQTPAAEVLREAGYLPTPAFMYNRLTKYITLYIRTFL